MLRRPAEFVQLCLRRSVGVDVTHSCWTAKPAGAMWYRDEGTGLSAAAGAGVLMQLNRPSAQGDFVGQFM